MDNKEVKKAPEVRAEVAEPEKAKMPQMNEQFMAMAMEITSGRQYTPTPEQVDRILSLQEKGMDYTHKERTTFLPTQIIETVKFVLVLLCIIGVFIFSAFYAQMYLSQIISGLFGLLAGSGIGYAIGYKKTRKNEE